MKMPSKDINVNVDEAGAGDILLKPTGEVTGNITTANGDGATVPMVGNNIPSLLETEEERKARRRSHYVVYFTTFIGSIGFSIVLTGVWPYLQQLDQGVSKEFLGWVIAANPLGQMITSPLMGIWANKAGSSRAPLLFTISIFVLGNILYSILNLFNPASRSIMVLSRFLVGVSFANMAVIRSYVAASTTTAERTTAVALTSASQGAGFIIGPALQAAIAVAFSHSKVSSSNSTLQNNTTGYQDFEEDNYSGIEWNMYTAAGWTAAVLGIINFFLFMPCIFKEQLIAEKEAQLQRNIANENNTKLPNPDYQTVIALLVMFFITQFVFVLLEVMLVPMCIDMYAWSDETALTVIGVGMCIAGIVATIMFGLAGPLARKFGERQLYNILGLVPIMLAMMSFIPMGNTYPKMQNCTLDVVEPNHRIERSVSPILPHHLEIVQNQLLPFMYKGDFQNNWNSEMFSDEFHGGKLNAFTKEEQELYESPSSFNRTIQDQQVLLRKRRGIRREKKCHDLGCPQEQEWCRYTPIIEKSQMIIGCLVAFIGYPISFTISSSLYSKLLGPKPQGLWMGILTSTGSFSRMTGPIFVSYMYAELGTRWTFGVMFVIMIFTLIISLIYYKRLVPMKITTGS